MNYDELMKLSIEELKELNSRILTAVKIKRESKSVQIKNSLSIGDTFTLNDKRYDGEEYVVLKVNRTRCKARQTKGPKVDQIYTIPFGMIEQQKTVENGSVNFWYVE